MAAVHEGAPKDPEKNVISGIGYAVTCLENLNEQNKQPRNILPDGIQHTGCDALPPGQAENPDPADPTQSLFWDGGAAPGSVSLHEVVLGHIFVSIRLLKNSVSLKRKSSGVESM